MKNLQLLIKDQYQIFLVIVMCGLIVLPFLHTYGIVLSIIFPLIAILSLVAMNNMEVFLILTIAAPALKASKYNPLPESFDATVIFYAALLLLLAVNFVIKKVKLPKLLPVDYILFLFVLWFLVTYFFTPSEAKVYGSFKLTRFIFLVLPFYFIPRVFVDINSIKKMGEVILVVGVLISIILFFTFSSALDMQYSGTSYLIAAQLGGYTAIWLLNNFFTHPSPKIRIASLLLSVFPVILTIKSSSRGALISLLFILFVIMSLNTKKNMKKVWTIIFLLFIVIIAYLIINPSIFDRFLMLFQKNKGGSISARLDLIYLSMDLLKSNWFTGIGLGGFIKYSGLKYPHNIFLEIFVEMGVVGFLLFIAIVITFFKRYFESVKDMEYRKSYEMPFFYSTIYMLLFHLTSYGIEGARLLFFFLGTSLYLGGKRLAEERRRENLT